MARPSTSSRRAPSWRSSRPPGRRGHHNLVSPLGPATMGPPTSCAGFNRPTDIVGVAPRIARLRSKGRPTQTIALRKGSAAINKAKRSTAREEGPGRPHARTHEGHRRVRAQHRALRVLTGRQPDRREPMRARALSGSDAQSGARGDHRRAPVVDCVDDLRGVDAVEIDRRHAEVDVAELALDHL